AQEAPVLCAVALVGHDLEACGLDEVSQAAPRVHVVERAGVAADLGLDDDLVVGLADAGDCVRYAVGDALPLEDLVRPHLLRRGRRARCGGDDVVGQHGVAAALQELGYLPTGHGAPGLGRLLGRGLCGSGLLNLEAADPAGSLAARAGHDLDLVFIAL